MIDSVMKFGKHEESTQEELISVTPSANQSFDRFTDRLHPFSKIRCHRFNISEGFVCMMSNKVHFEKG